MRIKWCTVGFDSQPNRGRVFHRLDMNCFDDLLNIGIDETSYKKGHKYITVIVSHDKNTVV